MPAKVQIQTYKRLLTFFLSIVALTIGGGIKSSVAPTTTTSSTIHNYLIVVTVNSLSNPIERLELGKDGHNTDEICALLSVIISRKQKHN